MPAACALGMISGKIIFDFEIAERLRTLRYLIHKKNHKLSLWRNRAVALIR